MANIYKINWIKASREDWEQLRAVLPNHPEKKKMFSDHQLTENELNRVLDTDKNGQLSIADFKGWDIKRFEGCSQILSRYGFTLRRKLYSSRDFPLADVPQSFWSSREFVLAVAHTDPHTLQFVAPELRADKEVALAALRNLASFQYIDPALKADREFVLAAVKQNGRVLRYFPPELRADRELVLAAVEEDSSAFEYAAAELKADREFFRAALRRTFKNQYYDGGLFEFVASELKADREFVLAALSEGASLKFVAPEFQADREVVLAAVKQNGEELKFADAEFKADREIVLAAIKEGGEALRFAVPELQADRELVFIAAKEAGIALKFASLELQNDTSFLLQLAQVNIGVLEYVEPKKQNEIWAQLASAQSWPKQFASSTFSNYQAFKRTLQRSYGISFIERFRSMGALHAVLASRTHALPASSTPLAVLIYSKVDENKGLQRYPLIDRLFELGYQVSYFEAVDELEAQANLAQATRFKKADLLVLAGHGSPFALNLGDNDMDSNEVKLKEESEKWYIDTSDFQKRDTDIVLRSFIEPRGDLILCGCSNGEGGEANHENLANKIAADLPAGITIHASELPMNIRDISYDQNGKVNVTWTTDLLYTTSGKAK